MASDTQKADQIAYRYYTKLALVVADARLAPEPRAGPAKVDKWFNLETPDSDAFKDALRLYRSVSAHPPAAPPPPLELQVLLAVPPLAPTQALVHHTPPAAPFAAGPLPPAGAAPSSGTPGTGTRVRIEPAPRLVLLESWTLAFTPSSSSSTSSSSSSSASPSAPSLADTDAAAADVAPPTMYKHGIPLFRSLYTLLRLLPAWAALRRLRRRTGSAGGARGAGALAVRVRVRPTGPGAADDERMLGFGDAPAPGLAPLLTQTHRFPALPHPRGALALCATFLAAPHFALDELESLLSSRFLSADAAPAPGSLLIHGQQRSRESDRERDRRQGTRDRQEEDDSDEAAPGGKFTPTLLKNQARESLSGSPGTTGITTTTGAAGFGALPQRVRVQTLSNTASPPAPLSSTSTGISGGAGAGAAAGTSIADRFVLPPPAPGTPHTRTTSFSSTGAGASARAVPLALPPVRLPGSLGGAGMSGSPGGASVVSSSSRHSGGSGDASGLGGGGGGVGGFRPRRESAGVSMGGGRADLPSLPSGSVPASAFASGSGSTSSPSPTAPTPGGLPMAIRRPHIHPVHVHPFKSSTLSSGSPSLHSHSHSLSGSPSLRHNSALTTGSGLGLGAGAGAGGASGSYRPSTGGAASAGAAGGGIGFPHQATAPPSPVLGPGSPSAIAGSRPSPPAPFAPSSLGSEPAFPHGYGGHPPRAKRYSSTFGHRHGGSAGTAGGGSASASASASVNASAVAEGGAAGVAGRVPLERIGSASYLSTATDDDDISVFVQDIDARKPLRSHRAPASESLPLSSSPTASALDGGGGTGAALREGQDARVLVPPFPHRRHHSLSSAPSPLSPLPLPLPLPGHERDTTVTGTSSRARYGYSRTGDREGSGEREGGDTDEEGEEENERIGRARPSRVSTVSEASREGSSALDSLSASGAAHASAEADAPGAPNASARPMLRTPTDVDERLRQMNEAFLVSLQGLGGARRSGSPARASSGSGSGAPPGTARGAGAGGSGRRMRSSTESRGSGAGEEGALGLGLGLGGIPPFPRSRYDSGSPSRSGLSGVSGGSGSVGSQEVMGRLELGPRGGGGGA